MNSPFGHLPILKSYINVNVVNSNDTNGRTLQLKGNFALFSYQ